ncbi:MAG TPA: hypothetical protein PK359_20985, partial [Burkholderiaceae bacterium]|nr:hypothetical protein [Burkholderiaceae bacterium]
SNCRLKGVLGNALKAYFAELDAVTLADIAGPPAPVSPRPRSVGSPRASAASRAAPRPVIRLTALKS